jgi:hypothetical protein
MKKKRERETDWFFVVVYRSIFEWKYPTKTYFFSSFFFVVVRKQIQTEIIQRWNLFLIIKEIRKRNYQIQNYFYHKFSCFLYTWAKKKLYGSTVGPGNWGLLQLIKVDQVSNAALKFHGTLSTGTKLRIGGLQTPKILL